MPFTPLHIGPCMVIKAAVPRHFSVVVFGITQIAVDLEVLWHLARHDYSLHTFWHTYLGATIIAALLTVLGKPTSQWIKAMWNRIAAKCRDADLMVPIPTTWLASLTGALVGAYSHILLDSLFHPDIEPLQPWSASNRLRGVVNPHGLEVLCVVLGLSGWHGSLIEKDGRGRPTSKSSLSPGSPAQADLRYPQKINCLPDCWYDIM